ncbi:MAG: DUF378 domain-containing protein [Candidatus Daviesbacteria bacterium]|nr:DUF378 domain-containing protein [Candidatus Daviesbacteria bacterium]
MINLDTKKALGWILALAAINWGLVGLVNLNLVELVLGAGSMLTRVVYIVIGLVGVYKLYMILTGGYKK